MKSVISTHSYRGGTGKSTLSANVAVALAQLGHKVVTVDLDLTSPGLHTIFEVPQSALKRTLNDFMYRRCSLEECTVDLTNHLGLSRGSLLFIGSSMKPEEIAQLMKKDYEDSLFKQLAVQLDSLFNIDYLIFDTHPGLVEDTLLAVLSSDLSLLVMRMDRQDISGTFLLTKVLRKMGKVCYILLNMVPPELAKMPGLTDDISRTMGIPTLALIPFYNEVLSHRSKGVFVLKHPAHPFSEVIYEVARTVSSW